MTYCVWRQCDNWRYYQNFSFGIFRACFQSKSSRLLAWELLDSESVKCSNCIQQGCTARQIAEFLKHIINYPACILDCALSPLFALKTNTHIFELTFYQCLMLGKAFYNWNKSSIILNILNTIFSVSQWVALCSR